MALITPRVQLKISAKGLIDKLRKRLDASKDSYVTVGVLEGAGTYPDGTSVVMVGLWNEFGTDKIPERSFLRGTIKANTGLINKWRQEMFENIIGKNWSVEKALEAIGFRVQELVRNAIKSNMGPENSKRTQAQKRRDGVPQRTLINTGLLLRSISYRVFTEAE